MFDSALSLIVHINKSFFTPFLFQVDSLTSTSLPRTTPRKNSKRRRQRTPRKWSKPSTPSTRNTRNRRKPRKPRSCWRSKTRIATPNAIPAWTTITITIPTKRRISQRWTRYEMHYPFSRCKLESVTSVSLATYGQGLVISLQSSLLLIHHNNAVSYAFAH